MSAVPATQCWAARIGWAVLLLLECTLPLRSDDPHMPSEPKAANCLRSLRPAPLPADSNTLYQIQDFFQEWASARNHVTGLSVYEIQEATAKRYLNRDRNVRERFFIEVNAHPPTSVLLVLPLARMNYADAFFVWNVVSLILIAGSVWLVARGLGARWSAWAVLPILALTFACSPLYQQVRQGQLNGVLLALIVGAWLADRTGREWLAGALVGTAAVIKLFPGFLFLYFMLRGRWRPLVGGMAAAALLTGITAAVLGTETYRTYVEDVIPKVEEFRSAWGNQSFAGLWSKLFDPLQKYDPIAPVIRSPALARRLPFVSAAAVVACLAVVVLKARSRSAEDAAFGATVTGMLLVSPITWDHYLLLLVIPIALLWVGLPRQGPARWTFRALLVLLWLPPGVYWYLAGLNANQTPAPSLKVFLGLSVQLLATLILFAMGLWLTRKLDRKKEVRAEGQVPCAST
jgi:hypothetical protein